MKIFWLMLERGHSALVHSTHFIVNKSVSYLVSGSGTLITQSEKVWEVFIFCFCCHSIRDFGQQTFIRDFWSKEFRARVSLLWVNKMLVSSAISSSLVLVWYPLLWFWFEVVGSGISNFLFKGVRNFAALSSVSMVISWLSTTTFCTFSSDIVMNIIGIRLHTFLVAFILIDLFDNNGNKKYF